MQGLHSVPGNLLNVNTFERFKAAQEKASQHLQQVTLCSAMQIVLDLLRASPGQAARDGPAQIRCASYLAPAHMKCPVTDEGFVALGVCGAGLAADMAGHLVWGSRAATSAAGPLPGAQLRRPEAFPVLLLVRDTHSAYLQRGVRSIV